MAKALIKISNTHSQLGNTAAVTETHQKVEKILYRLDPAQRMNYEAALGSLCLYLGEYETAINHFSTIAKVFTEQGNNVNQAACLDNMGTIYRMLGDYHKSQEHHDLALQISRDIEHTTLEANCLSNIGILFYYQGEYHRAFSKYQEALSIFESSGVRHQMLNTLINIAIVGNALKQQETTVAFFTRALSIAKEVGDLRSAAYINGHLIEITRTNVKDEGAIERLREVCDSLHNCWRCAAGVFRSSLALMLAEQEEFEEAIELIRCSEEDVRVERFEYAMFLCKKTMVYSSGQVSAAQKAMQEAELASKEVFTGENSILGDLLQRSRSMVNGDNA